MSNEETWARLAEAATPGPWELGWEDGNGWVAFVDNEGERGAAERHIVTSRHAEGDNANADASFIAAAREAVPALLAEVSQLRAENERQAGKLIEHNAAQLDRINERCSRAESALAAARAEASQLRAKIERFCTVESTMCLADDCEDETGDVVHVSELRALLAEPSGHSGKRQAGMSNDYSQFQVIATELDFDLDCKDCPWRKATIHMVNVDTLKDMIDLADKHRREVHA